VEVVRRGDEPLGPGERAPAAAVEKKVSAPRGWGAQSESEEQSGSEEAGKARAVEARRSEIARTGLAA
jgi:hypothetical protein